MAGTREVVPRDQAIGREALQAEADDVREMGHRRTSTRDPSGEGSSYDTESGSDASGHRSAYATGGRLTNCDLPSVVVVVPVVSAPPHAGLVAAAWSAIEPSGTWPKSPSKPPGYAE